MRTELKPTARFDLTRVCAAAALSVGIAGAIACGSGGSGPAQIGKGSTNGGDEPGTSGVEPGTGSPEPTGGGYEPPGGGSSSGGASSSGGGSSSGGSSPGGPKGGPTCLACVTYTCTAKSGSSSITETLTLSNTSDGCVVEGSAIVLSCSGGVTLPDGGTASGAWTATAGGGFTISTGSGTLICTP